MAEVVGGNHVVTDPSVTAGFAVDWTRRFTGTCPAVLRPGSTAEVAAIVALCARDGVVLVPQGGNSSLSGGSVPGAEGAVVLSATRMDRIDEIDERSLQVTVEAGATLAALQAAAATHGLFFPIDHAARDVATLGGMAATNAGGSWTFRHGTMRRHVMGLEAVLADGSTISHLAGLPKDNTGYDLTGLLVGSEGTLGVITRLRLQLVPLQPMRATALVGVSSLGGALDLLVAIRRDLPSMLACELMFRDGMDAVCAHTNLSPPLPDAHEVYVLIDCAAHEDPADDLAAALSGVSVGDVVFAATNEQRTRLWEYRERHNETVNALGVPHKMDVTLPLEKLEHFVTKLGRRIPDGGRLICYGHLADGNLHVNVVGPSPEDEAVDAAVLRLTVDLGGSISAEHGIGRAKRSYLHLVRSEAEIETMWAIKRALDPNGILNPGVLL